MIKLPALLRGVAWIPASALLLVWGLSTTPWFERLEELALDAQMRLTARQQDLTDALVIDIDDASLKAMQPYFGGWPYKRETYGQLVDYLTEMGARAVAFDIVMADPRDGDEGFRQSIHRNANVVLATAARLDASPTEYLDKTALQGLGWQVPEGLKVETWPSGQLPLPAFTQPAPAYARLGVVSAVPEKDGLLRRIPLFHRIAGEYLPAIPLAAHFPNGPVPVARLNPDSTVQIGPLSIPVDKEGAIHLYFPSNKDPVVSLPFAQVAQAMLGMAGPTLADTTFQDKTVFVGSTAFFTDRILTPVGELKGVNVLGLIHQSLAQGLLYKPATALWSGLLLLMALLPSLGLLLQPRRSVYMAALAGLGAALLVYGSHSALLYWRHQESVLLLPLLVAAVAFLLEAVRTQKISQAERADQISTLTHDDALTGLPNRQSMQTHLAALIEQVTTPKGVFAVLLIDLDHFQTINHSLGHQTGDQLLLETRNRLVNCLQAHERPARVGDDEFAVLVGGADHATAMQSAERILAALNRPYTLVGQQLHITASMGISLFPGDGADVQRLLQNADTALHYAKAQGRSTYRFFTPALNQSITAQMQVENQLR